MTWGTVQATVSSLIRAPAERVAAVYADHDAWPRTFGATIKGGRLVRDDGADKTLEIDHVEGKVTNVLHVVGPHEIDLDEQKKRFTARFENHFDPAPGGTRYTLVAAVTLRGAYRLLAPVLGPLVRARMKRFVVDPLRDAAERG